MHTKVVVVYDTHFAGFLSIINKQRVVAMYHHQSQKGTYASVCNFSIITSHMPFYSIISSCYYRQSLISMIILSSKQMSTGTTYLKLCQDISIKYCKISMYHKSHHTIPLAFSFVIFSSY